MFIALNMHIFLPCIIETICVSYDKYAFIPNYFMQIFHVTMFYSSLTCTLFTLCHAEFSFCTSECACLVHYIMLIFMHDCVLQILMCNVFCIIYHAMQSLCVAMLVVLNLCVVDSFVALSSSAIYVFYNIVLKIDEEEYNGHGALLQEGIFTSVMLFLVSCIDMDVTI